MAYRPMTERSHDAHFRTFIALCMQMGVFDVQVQHVWCSMQSLSASDVSVNMIANCLLALKTNLIIYGFNQAVLADARIKLYIKSLRINRPFKPIKHNIMTIMVLQQLVILGQEIFIGPVAYLGFLRFSNIAPHLVALFDSSRHRSRYHIYFQFQ